MLHRVVFPLKIRYAFHGFMSCTRVYRHPPCMCRPCRSMPVEERRADEKTLSEVHYSCRQKPYRWLPQPSSSGVAHVLWHRQPVIISQRFADRCQRVASPLVGTLSVVPIPRAKWDLPFNLRARIPNCGPSLWWIVTNRCANFLSNQTPLKSAIWTSPGKRCRATTTPLISWSYAPIRSVLKSGSTTQTSSG